jgi:hypothetical protein
VNELTQLQKSARIHDRPFAEQVLGGLGLDHPQRDSPMVSFAIEDSDNTMKLVRLMDELQLQAMKRMKGIVYPNLCYICIVS